MKKLTAQQNILFESRIYSPGDELPTKNTDMVNAWIAAGTAVWTGDETPEEVQDETLAKTPVTARPATAEPGQPGVAVASESENGENMIGRVPKTASRKKK